MRRRRNAVSYGGGPVILHRQQFALDTRAATRQTGFMYLRAQSDRANPLPVSLGQPVIPSKFQPVSRPTLNGGVMATAYFQASQSTTPGQDIWQYAGKLRGGVDTQEAKPRMTQRPFHNWVFGVPVPSQVPNIVPVGR